MKRSRIVAAGIVFLGIGIFWSGQGRKWLCQGTEASPRTISQENCMLCSETDSVFEFCRTGENGSDSSIPEDSPLFLCNINTGDCIDLLLGNPDNRENNREQGRRELHFPRGEETTVRVFSLSRRDLCEITMYLDRNSSRFEEAKERLCLSCLEQMGEGNTEFVLCSRKERAVYPFVSGVRLFFAGDYGVHLDWKKEEERIDALVFYSPNISCTVK